MMWAKAPTGGLLSFPVTGTEQELRTLTHQQDQTPSLEPTRGDCLSVGPKDHLQEDCHRVVKMPVSGFHNQNLGLGARQPAFCVMLPCGLCTWRLKTFGTLMGEWLIDRGSQQGVTNATADMCPTCPGRKDGE